MATEAWRQANKEKMRAYRRAWYSRNRAHAIEEIKRRKREIASWYREFKKSLMCAKCGEDHPGCLDFHHRDEEEKDRPVSQMLRLGKKRILAEIAKCDVLCANCHRKHHYRGVA